MYGITLLINAKDVREFAKLIEVPTTQKSSESIEGPRRGLRDLDRDAADIGGGSRAALTEV